MNGSVRRAALACALLATTAISGLAAAPAHAQAFGDTERQAPDENGVDVISGKVSVPIRSITAGRAGEGGLTYASGWAGGSYYDSFKLEIFDQASGAYVTIYGNKQRFTKDSSGNYTTVDADGSTLVFDSGINGFIYTARDGTVIRFLKSLGDTGLGTLVTARAEKVTRPDGEVINYYYRLEAGQGCTGFPCSPLLAAARVQSVTSTLGYQLKATYASNTYGSGTQGDFKRLTKVIAINNAVDYCSPTADSCTGLTQAWPELTLGNSTSSGVTTRTFTDNASQTTTATSTSAGPTAVTSPASGTADLAITYDTSNRVSTLARGGGTWGYSYADSGNQRTTTVTQPLGGSKVYVSDLTLKRVLSVTDELSRTRSFTYDTDGRPLRDTAPEGNYVEVAYDSRGNVTQTTAVAKSGSGLSNIVTSAAFPSSCTNPKTCNQPSSTTDARGNVTDYSYDSTHGGLLTITRPAPTSGAVRPETRFSYSSLSAYYKNSTGTIVAAPSAVYRMTAVSACQTGSSCAGTSDEAKTTLAYGSTGVANNLLATSVSSGAGDGSLTATTAATYDSFGNLATVDGPLAGSDDTTRFRYDSVRRRVGSISPDPDGAGSLKHRAVKFDYDADGNVTTIKIGTVNSQSDADWAGFSTLQTVTIGYDSLGRPTSERLGTALVALALTQYSYDSKGRLDCTAQRMNISTFSTPPSSACTLATQGSHGPDRIVKNVYDNADQVTQVKTSFGVTGQETNEVSSTYRSNGQVETVTDGEGNKTTYEYDGHDRLSKTRFPDTTRGAGTSSTTNFEQLTYDSGSNVTNRQLRDGTSIGYGYDTLNRLVSKDLPGSEPDVAYTYDALGRMTGASQSGNALSFTYDALSRNLTQAGPQGTVASSYDPAGRRTRITHPDGFYVDQDYLLTGETTKIRENGATSGVGLLAQYGYDDLGRRTSLTRGDGSVESYSYNTALRLSQIADDLVGSSYDQTLGFIYNPAGQIASNTRSNDLLAWGGHYNIDRGYSANGLNQYTTAGTVTPAYDSRGNLTSAGPVTYGYASENLLTAASGGISFGYDPFTRLYQSAGATTTRFAYDGADLIAEYDGSNSLLRRYVHGPGVDEPLAWYEGSGTTGRRFLHSDERGSIVAVTDSAGSIVATNSYDEYGIPAAGNLGRFQYTGQTWLPEISMYYYKARIYSPTLGRFLQPDPIGYGDGMNIYAYVGADPVDLRDPSGLCDGDGDTPEERAKTCDVVVTAPELGSGGFGALQAPDIIITGKRHGCGFLGLGCFVQRLIHGTNGRRRTRTMCPTGPQLTVGAGGSATAFLAIVGVSTGGGATLSIPKESLPLVGDGSFRGTQISGSASITPLAGLGAFLGAGPNYSLGGSAAPTPRGLSGSVTPTIQAGVGDGAGIEVSSDFTYPPNLSGSGGRIAAGVYGAVGARFQGTLSTGPIGCE